MTKPADNTDLAERVEQLEEKVESQQETIRKLMPSRRAMLKGGATAGAAALLGFSGGSASASTGTAGQIGTQSDRPDIFSDSLDANGLTLNLDASDGTTEDVLSGSTINGEDFTDRHQRTTSVSTSDTVIWSYKEASGNALILVAGAENNDTSRFFDLVHMGRAASPTVINSQGSSSPDSRSYSRSGGDLQLSMSANTYSVSARSINAPEGT